MQIRIALATVVALALGLSLGCTCDRSTPAEVGRAGTPMTIGYSRLRISLPLFVAQERGIFARHGIDAELVMYDTAQPLMQSLVEGRVDVAGYTALPITYNGMLRSGTKLLFLTALVEDQDHRISYLLRRRPPAGHAPAIRSIGDLSGHRIGILPTVAYRVWLEEILAANGVAAGSVTLQPVEPLVQPQALASGGVDALFTNDPAATAAIVEGIAEPITDFVEVPRYLGEPFLFGSFNVRADWAEAHPGELARLAAALDEACAFVNEHPEDAKGAMAPYLPEAFREHTTHYPHARYLTTAQTREESFVRAAEDYERRQIIPGHLDLRGLVWSADRER